MTHILYKDKKDGYAIGVIIEEQNTGYYTKIITSYNGDIEWFIEYLSVDSLFWCSKNDKAGLPISQNTHPEYFL